MVKKGFVKPRIMKKSCSETKYKRITSTTYQSFYATGNITARAPRVSGARAGRDEDSTEQT